MDGRDTTPRAGGRGDYEQRERSGILFRSYNKQSERAPDFVGSITYNGEKLRLAGWTKKSARGNSFLSLAVTPESEAREAAAKAAQERTERQDRAPRVDDDLPF